MSSRSSSPSSPSPRSSCSSEEEEEAGAAECRSPVGLEGCSCCLALADRGLGAEEGRQGDGNGNGSPPRASPGSPFLRLRGQLFCRRNLNAAKLSRMLARGGSLEPVVRDPCYLRNQGVCNRNIDQTLLSILLFFHSASGASVVAIDSKIEQAMDLVKNHLMYAVREEVEILKEQIKELAEKNSQLEQENSLLKNLASPEQLQKFQSCLPLEVRSPSPPPPPSLASPSPAAERQSAPGGPAAAAAEAVRAQHRAGSAV